VKLERIIAVVGTCLSLAAPALAQPKTLDVYWIDVEGGAATLIVTPAGESVLIDTGWPDERGAPRIQKVATEVAGVRQIDHLITTHFHIDHFGGATALSKLMPVRRVYDNGAPTPPPSGRDVPAFEEYVKTFEGVRTLLKPGFTVPLKAQGGAAPALKLAATRQQVADAGKVAKPNAQTCAVAEDKAPDTSDNANSTVWILEVGRFRFFDGGDLTWNTEATLVCPVDRIGQVDVYQVNHHGLAASNNPVLIRTLAPTVTVMNNGPRKGGDAATVTLLESLAGSTHYQVHKDVRHEESAPSEQIANVPEQCSANYIKMSVESSGQRYTISIPATGYSRVFSVRGS
jgi:beta-lactamase superfamily II metal-dependent hydrolase